MPSLRDAEGPFKSHRYNARNWRLVTDDYGTEHWWFRCSICKGYRPWLKDKKPTNYYCPKCHNARKRREYREIQQNTDRHISVLEERRFRYRDRQFAKGVEPKPQLGVARLKYPLASQRKKERLPIEPLSEWAIKRAKAYGGNKGLAEYCGVDERTITRIVHKEYPEINFSTVDAILTNEGSTFIWDLYPEEYERLLEVA